MGAQLFCQSAFGRVESRPDSPRSVSSSAPWDPWALTCGICAPPTASEKPMPVYPDFTGEWVCFGYEGDIDAYLSEMGASFLARLGARLRRYDIADIARILKHDGDKLDIDVKCGKRRYIQMLIIGAGPQACEDEDGIVMVDPTWEKQGKEHVLCLEITEQDGSKPRTSRQWISDGHLTVEYTTRSACCVKWHFRRKDRPKASSMMCPPPPAPPLELLRNGKPDFSGTWKSHTYKGDVDGFFEEMGVGKAARTAMSALNYGVGMVEKVIVQNGDEFQITDAWPTGPTTQKFTVEKGEQVTVGTQGKDLYVTPVWEHNHVLRVATQPLDRSVTPNGPMRYFFEGSELVVVYESMTGQNVRYFHRRVK